MFLSFQLLEPACDKLPKEIQSIGEKQKFPVWADRQCFSDGRWVEIFAANTNEFPAIYHQRAIFLCFFLLIVQKKEGKSEYSWNLFYNIIKRFGQSW